jgi:hypothetical protein
VIHQAASALGAAKTIFISSGAMTAQKTNFLRLAACTAEPAEKSNAYYEIKNGLDGQVGEL